MKKLFNDQNNRYSTEEANNLIYNKIINDTYILNFIKKNGLSKEDVYKNLEQFYGYIIAKEKVRETNHIPKLLYLNNTVYVEYGETSEYKEQVSLKRKENTVKTEYIAKGVLKSNFKNITNNKNKNKVALSLVSICNEFLLNKPVKGIYLYGKTGIGKTYLMGSLYNYLKESGKEPAIIYFPEFIRKIKSKIKDGEYNTIVDLIREQEILIIDDIGSENITEFVRDEIIVPIINYRSTEGLLTFFTSNLGFSELLDVFASTKNKIDETKALRIVSRIEQLAEPLLLDSKNERN